MSVYDLSDHVYIYVNLNIASREVECKGGSAEEVKYLWVKDEQLMNEFVRKFERSMEGQRGGDGAEMRVEEYDSLMMSYTEEVLQRTFKKRNTRKVKGIVDHVISSFW